MKHIWKKYPLNVHQDYVVLFFRRHHQGLDSVIRDDRKDGDRDQKAFLGPVARSERGVR